MRVAEAERIKTLNPLQPDAQGKSSSIRFVPFSDCANHRRV
jgi:hypothetical protein